MATVAKKARVGRPSGGGSVTREKIVEVALAQIDEAGLPALSMRDIAARLGVYPATVQWHVRSKEELLAEVATLVMDGVVPPPARHAWKEWLAELFRRCRKALKKHPNVAQLIGAQMVSNASVSTALVEGILLALEEAGFEGQALLETYNAVVAAMLGFATMEFAPLPAENTEVWAASLKERVHAIRPLEHPALARHLPMMANQAFIVRWENGVTRPMDESFERYVRIFLDGLEAMARSVGPEETSR